MSDKQQHLQQQQQHDSLQQQQFQPLQPHQSWPNSLSHTFAQPTNFSPNPNIDYKQDYCYFNNHLQQTKSPPTIATNLKCDRIGPIARSHRETIDNSSTTTTTCIAPYHYHHPTPNYCPTNLQLINQNYTLNLAVPNQQQPLIRFQAASLNYSNYRYNNRYYTQHHQTNPPQRILRGHKFYYLKYSQTLLQQTKQISMSVQSSTTTTTTTQSGPKLIWLLFMHRHGDRAPLNMAPRDKYNNITYWAEGFGNLNNAGRMRMFKMGKFIRRRYDGFLSDNIREVYSRSSDVDRCIESSHALLAGLYPPTNRFEWNKELLWLPAPVHTVPAPEDYLLNEAGRKFLMEFINEIQIVQNSEAVKKLYEESVHERELLERELGYEYDMFYKFKCTYSTLDIEERNGLTMPAWYTPELKQKLYRFAGIAFGLAGGGTEKLKKIRCGHLLEDITTRMEMSSIEGPKLKDHSEFNQPTNSPTEIDDRKIIHYSTHDSIMAAFLESLNINSPTPVPPGFGAIFFIELYVDLNEQGQPISEKYVKLFYMDDTDSERPIEKKLPNARLNEKGQLTLNNFKKYIEHLLPNGNTACQV